MRFAAPMPIEKNTMLEQSRLAGLDSIAHNLTSLLEAVEGRTPANSTCRYSRKHSLVIELYLKKCADHGYGGRWKHTSHAGVSRHFHNNRHVDSSHGNGSTVHQS